MVDSKCELCKDSKEHEYHYWHGDIEEEYDMGQYTCLCYLCFNQLNTEGKINWRKHDRSNQMGNTPSAIRK